MVLTSSDLVLYKDGGGNYTAGGYNLSSINNTTNQVQHGGSSKLNDLAVPAGLLFLQQNTHTHYQVIDNDDVVSDSLYDKLVSLASADGKANISKAIKRKTKKSTPLKAHNKKTRRTSK
jgi:hypothetical protein